MATTTTNYHLIKPEMTDYATPTPFNDNMDTLDTVVKAISDKANTNETAISTINSGKMPVVNGATTGNMAVFNANGQCVDSGLKIWVDDGILKITY